ncbi:MAG: hypothetical protein IT572_05625 [Deltaproteobacteria bacterium]|nr:hypothetical protein [Deltaproteobacteria bacterium]
MKKIAALLSFLFVTSSAWAGPAPTQTQELDMGAAWLKIKSNLFKQSPKVNIDPMLVKFKRPTYTYKQLDIEGSCNISSVKTGDLNGDGKDDIAYYVDDLYEIGAKIAQPNGGFADTEKIKVLSRYTLAVADTDNDNIGDLIGSNHQQGFFTIKGSIDENGTWEGLEPVYGNP